MHLFVYLFGWWGVGLNGWGFFCVCVCSCMCVLFFFLVCLFVVVVLLFFFGLLGISSHKLEPTGCIFTVVDGGHPRMVLGKGE